MPVSTDILESYVRPRQVFRRKLEGGTHEGRALATLIGACLLIFVAQWPGQAREAHINPAIPLDARMGGALLGTLFLLPPIAYAVAALSHLVSGCAFVRAASADEAGPLRPLLELAPRGTLEVLAVL